MGKKLNEISLLCWVDNVSSKPFLLIPATLELNRKYKTILSFHILFLTWKLCVWFLVVSY